MVASEVSSASRRSWRVGDGIREWKWRFVPRRQRRERTERREMISSWSSVGSVGSVGDGLEGGSFMVSDSMLL